MTDSGAYVNLRKMTMKTILIGVLFWLLVVFTAGCVTASNVVKEIGGDLSHLVVDDDGDLGWGIGKPKIRNGRVMTAQEQVWSLNRLSYLNGDEGNLNDRIFWGENPFGPNCNMQRSAFDANGIIDEEALISPPNFRVGSTSGPFYPIGGRGYYSYGGKLHRIPPRNTIEYDWYLRRKAWGDFK